MTLSRVKSELFLFEAESLTNSDTWLLALGKVGALA